MIWDVDRPVGWGSGCWRELRSVWATGQQDQSAQLRDGGYVSGAELDVQGIAPVIAAHAVEFYSRAGELVVDPDCGAGSVLVEAVRAGRHAVGLTENCRWWRVARANLTEAKRAGAWPDGAVLDARSGGPLAARRSGLGRRADLVLTTIRRRSADGLSPDSDLESEILGRVRLWTSLLRPGGHAVVVLRPYRSLDGTLLDLPTAVLSAAVACCLIPVDRCVAVTACLRGNRVITRASVGERRAVDRAWAGGAPIALAAHHTVLILKAPDLTENSLWGSSVRWSGVSLWPTTDSDVWGSAVG